MDGPTTPVRLGKLAQRSSKKTMPSYESRQWAAHISQQPGPLAELHTSKDEPGPPDCCGGGGSKTFARTAAVCQRRRYPSFFSTEGSPATYSKNNPVRPSQLVSEIREPSRLRGEITVDTTYQRKYHILKGGMADWAVYSTQLNNGPTETRALLGLGAEFLGGETNIELNYSSKYNFEKRQQQYHWRWANNNTKLVKQVTVGKISSRSVASIYSPLIGTVITNTPTTYRRSFGSYTMSDFTEPGWTLKRD